jgi:hypothetical protein
MTPVKISVTVRQLPISSCTTMLSQFAKAALADAAK